MERLIKTYNENEVIFIQGDAADCMYVVRSGRIGIFVNYGKDDEKQLTALSVGQFFGEMGMIENSPRSATAVVLEDGTQLEAITANNFAAYFQENPAQVLMIMKNMSQRIRGLTHDYLEACRAIAETVEAQNDESKRTSLKTRLKKFLDDYSAAYKMINEASLDVAPGFHGPFWM